MSKFKFKLNSAGVRSLLKGQEMIGILKKEADAVRSRAGEGYVSNTYVGKNRANASVKVGDYRSYRDNLKNNTLTKALK